MSLSEAQASKSMRYLVFALADRRFAVEMDQIVRVVHAVEIHPLEGSPDVISGYVDLRGVYIPVVDLRRRLKLSERELRLSDQMVLVQRGVWRAFVVADEVVAVVEIGNRTDRDLGDPDVCCTADLHTAEGDISVLDVGRLINAEEARFVRRLLAQQGSV